MLSYTVVYDRACSRKHTTEASDKSTTPKNRLHRKIEDDRSDAVERIEQLQRKHQLDVKETRRRTEQLEDENQILNNQLNELCRENQQLKFHIEQLENDKHTLEKEIEALKIELNILKKNGNIIKEELGETKKELKETQHDLDLVKRQTEKEREQKNIEEKLNMYKLLLGEVAFKLDQVVINHVFQDRYKVSHPESKKWKIRARSLTFAQVLNKCIEPMEAEENKRLNDFIVYLQKHGWYDGFHMADVLNELKNARFQLAHLSAQSKYYQDRQSLIQAAGCAGTGQ
ncbi:unnamed protein product [Adineta steineri]|uniref:Uncharacterized protein n=1 Tax=Adineta steineri TaxID=433720 RepID=A0A813VB16_9BILA|nr:unnamed protein product [Adineta steineri]